MAITITLPTLSPRDYQKDVYSTVLSNNKKKHLIMMHRRAGKTLTLLNIVTIAAMKDVNKYLILLPFQTQARNILWKGKLENGASIIDACIPRELIDKKLESTMSIELINGSVIQIAGADNIDSIVGSQFKGLVLDEAALVKPEVYAYLKPIIESNDGWVILSSTPRYDSWFNHLVDKGETDEFSLTVKDIHSTGVFDNDKIARLQQEYINQYGQEDGEAYFATEYLCSTSATGMGSYYSNLIDKHFKECVFNENEDVYAAWDLGQNDSTVITLFQNIDNNMLIIDCIEGRGKTVQDYQYSLSKQYKIKKHFLPHDAAQVRGYTSSESAEQVLRKMHQPLKVLPVTRSVMDDINLVRQHVPSIQWASSVAAPNVGKLLKEVKKYSRQSNGKPEHSDYADSFRYAVIGHKELLTDSTKEKASTYVASNKWSNSKWKGLG